MEGGTAKRTAPWPLDHHGEDKPGGPDTCTGGPWGHEPTSLPLCPLTCPLSGLGPPLPTRCYPPRRLPPSPPHHPVEEQGEACGQEAQRWAPEDDVQDVAPVEAPVGGAPDLGVQEVGQAEGVHHDQRLREGGAAGPAEDGPRRAGSAVGPPWTSWGRRGDRHPALHVGLFTLPTRHGPRPASGHSAPATAGGPGRAGGRSTALTAPTHPHPAPEAAGGRPGGEGRPTCTAPIAMTHTQNRKMPSGTSGKAIIKENCSQTQSRSRVQATSLLVWAGWPGPRGVPRRTASPPEAWPLELRQAPP